ncbi:MAG TPA: adenylate/guanylate cyclase domain-containing protein [Sphingomicrobium sp.]|nr:adenylate/guanylate cyclase domain-containing protein [Sphingomicrobium sp.]
MMEHTGRARDSVEEAEEAGLVFAFRARCVAILVVAVSVVVLVAWPRDLYYLGFVAGFFVSGYVPYRLRRHPRAELIKLGFVVLDVALIAAAVLNFPSGGVSIDWPIQTRLRNQNFVFMLLLLGEAALTYSPRRVVWTGASIVTIWSLTFLSLYQLPDSKRYGDMGLQQTDSDLLDLFLSPTYVSLPQWLTQLVATSILTALLAIAVYRSRTHLLAQVQAQALRSELARYVSPDVADALAQRPSAEFGAPANRHVAVLFADIVGFTRLNERLSPERTFALLRSFRERSTAVVFRHQGTLDKYLGDGFMATFGALREEPDAAARAIACAFELQAEVERWNAKRSARQADRLSIAIGVHFGPVVVGNVGAEQRIEFTVVGDVVNVASRLEQATRELGCILAVSDDCVRAAARAGQSPRFDRSVHLQVRGRKVPLVVHVAGALECGVSDPKVSFLAGH